MNQRLARAGDVLISKCLCTCCFESSQIHTCNVCCGLWSYCSIVYISFFDMLIFRCPKRGDQQQRKNCTQFLIKDVSMFEFDQCKVRSTPSDYVFTSKANKIESHFIGFILYTTNTVQHRIIPLNTVLAAYIFGCAKGS